MGTPMTIEVAATPSAAVSGAIAAAFASLAADDARFSTYRPDSEVSAINAGRIGPSAFTPLMREVLRLSAETKAATHGYFDVQRGDGTLDPSGLVKGWALRRAAQVIRERGFTDFFVDGGGDVDVRGTRFGEPWSVGIRNPFAPDQVVKVLTLRDRGIATSGTYLRGVHIYDPTRRHAAADQIASMTVVGPDVYEADRFATAAFAMGTAGITFIAGLPGFDGYAIGNDGFATMTPGFTAYAAVPPC